MAGYTGYPELELSDVDCEDDELRDAMPGGDGGSGQGTSKIDEIVEFASSGTPGDGALLCKRCDSTVLGGTSEELDGLSKATFLGEIKAGGGDDGVGGLEQGRPSVIAVGEIR